MLGKASLGQKMLSQIIDISSMTGPKKTALPMMISHFGHTLRAYKRKQNRLLVGLLGIHFITISESFRNSLEEGGPVKRFLFTYHKGVIGLV